MAKNLQVDETVFVPRVRLGLDLNNANAFYNTSVCEVNDRSVRVSLPGGGWSDWIGSSAVHRNVGILILRIGDYQSEIGLLEPLKKSVLQYFRLLLPDDMVRAHEMRTTEELAQIWAANHAGFSHVIVIGHGRRNAIRFGANNWQNAAQLGAIFGQPNPNPKTFVSLCCETGYADFGRPFSELSCCESLIAPFHTVHGAVASQFCQTLFAHHLLSGSTLRVAFNNSRLAIPGGKRFRLWDHGDMTGEAS
jgi:hypothetical protein